MARQKANKLQRSCVACGARADKTALYRIVRTPAGDISFDSTGRVAGRGAYVCSPECFAVASARTKLERALRTRLDKDDCRRLAEQIKAAWRVDKGAMEE